MNPVEGEEQDPTRHIGMFFPPGTNNALVRPLINDNNITAILSFNSVQTKVTFFQFNPRRDPLIPNFRFKASRPLSRIRFESLPRAMRGTPKRSLSRSDIQPLLRSSEHEAAPPASDIFSLAGRVRPRWINVSRSPPRRSGSLANRSQIFQQVPERPRISPEVKKSRTVALAISCLISDDSRMRVSGVL